MALYASHEFRHEESSDESGSSTSGCKHESGCPHESVDEPEDWDKDLEKVEVVKYYGDVDM